MTETGLALRLLGPLRVERNGEAVALPPSKKARALLGYLVTTGRQHRRQQLSDLLWDVADDPRGGLRWCLSKLRGPLDDPERVRIVADREHVRLDLTDADVDLHRVHATNAGLQALDTESVCELAELFHGELLEGLDLQDFQEFQSWLTAARGDCRRLRVRVLTAAVARLSDDVERALPFARDLVRLDPADVERRLQLCELLERSGRHREAEQQIEVGRRVLADRGADNPAYRQLFTSSFMPGATLEHMKWFNDLQRMTASPDNALRLRVATADIDVREFLPLIQAPTLVLHARGDGAVQYERGLALASGIPNARFVTLESDNHLLLEDEPAWPKFLEEVRRFLAEQASSLDAVHRNVDG